jgi:hypothetical protein
MPGHTRAQIGAALAAVLGGARWKDAMRAARLDAWATIGVWRARCPSLAAILDACVLIRDQLRKIEVMDAAHAAALSGRDRVLVELMHYHNPERFGRGQVSVTEHTERRVLEVGPTLRDVIRELAGQGRTRPPASATLPESGTKAAPKTIDVEICQ